MRQGFFLSGQIDTTEEKNNIIFYLSSFFTSVFLPIDYIFDSVESDQRKRMDHGEDHPDVNHLDVGGFGEGLGDSDKAKQ